MNEYMFNNAKKVFRVAIIVCVIVLCIIFFPRKGSLSGRWEPIEGYSSSLEYLEFFKDGTYVSGHSNYEGNYSVDGNRIRLQGILVDSRTFTYKINRNNLTLINSKGEIHCIFEKVTD